MRITILSDNQACQGLVAEHGLSVWIETKDICILFDTGQGSTLQNNARVLDLDLGRTDILVLSHGHYDHTGGIPQVLQRARNIDVYCHPGVGQPRYTIRTGKPKHIGMSRESVTAIGKLPLEQLHWVQQPLFLSEKIGITGPIPRETGYENPGGPFYLDLEGRRADPIDDDLALWIRTEYGLVVYVGCSHAGIVNTLNQVRRMSANSKIRAVIGGFHLLHANTQRIEQTLHALRSMPLGLLVPCHCTGKRAVQALKDSFGDQVLCCGSGTTFRL
jgi:7,8-dihydropterin-6-yl-methyl-4-(beta-D-ribofuranosyl)aminobenzene 5'-phosphate synthase